ncbi:hypothetical protein [Almyronema epifaneia]|uniref:Uncharacterized protein n=1 Tax=Almyronema epifaneia S1 TaxID=2991925 RepID=A0ABW6IB18_9CYAN
MPALTLHPGKFVRLKGQPQDLPDFVVVHCQGDRCWVRQQAWGSRIHLQIKVTQLEIPGIEVVPDSRLQLPKWLLVTDRAD